MAPGYLHQRPFMFARVLLVIALLSLSSQALVAVTEVLKDPVGGESSCPGGSCHEFVELTNLGPDTLFVDSLFLTDGSVVDSVLPWSTPIATCPSCITGSRIVPPGASALVIDPDYASSPVSVRYSIADSTVLWTVHRTSIVGGLTRDKGILLFRGTPGTIVDSLAGALDPGQEAQLAVHLTQNPAGTVPEGKSIVPSSVLFADGSWTANADTLTPGKFAGITQGLIVEYRLAPALASAPSVSCTVAVHSTLARANTAAEWSIKASDAGSPCATGTCSLSSRPAFFVTSLPKQAASYILSVSADGANAERMVDLSPAWIPPSPVRISEVSPRASDNLPEWVEVVNVTTMPIDLAYWRLGTPESADTVTTAARILAPGEYLVITRDLYLFRRTYAVGIGAIQADHWQALDNYRDTIVLYSPLDSVPAEMVYYQHTWFTQWDDESLERIRLDGPAMDSTTWTVAARSTPGQPNGSVAWRAVSRPSLFIGPMPFTPNGDGRDDNLAINLALPGSYTATVSVYGFDGVELRRFAGPPRPQYLWDGRTSDGARAPVGPFFVVAEVRGNGERRLLRRKGVLWR